MEYKTPSEAKDLPGLRLALTAGLPAPWSMAARFMFDVKGIDYVPVQQIGGMPNEELVAWTGHRNAPVAMYNEEPAQTHWADIIHLAERINPEPRLVPENVQDRILMFGLANEIAGAGGLLYSSRLIMLDVAMKKIDQIPEPIAEANRTMAKAYGYSVEAAKEAGPKVQQIFKALEMQLEKQKSLGSSFFVGEKLTALDLIWAAISNAFGPLPEDINPMDPGMRKVYTNTGAVLKTPEILFEHRDFIYNKHLTLPLDF